MDVGVDFDDFVVEFVVGDQWGCDGGGGLFVLMEDVQVGIVDFGVEYVDDDFVCICVWFWLVYEFQVGIWCVFEQCFYGFDFIVYNCVE